MLALLVTTCALATASLCEHHTIALPGASETTCLAVAQGEVARHLRPGWRIVRFGCARTHPDEVVASGPPPT